VGWEALETIGWEAISNFLDGNAFFQLVAEKPAAKFGVGNPFGLGSPLN